MLKLTKFCILSILVALIEIPWSVYDLSQEAVVFVHNSAVVGKFYIKPYNHTEITSAYPDPEDETKLRDIFYWLLLLFVIIVNCVWIVAAFKLLFGIVKAVVLEDRLNGLKCLRVWHRFSLLLLVIFGVKICRSYNGFTWILPTLAIVFYRMISMYMVSCYMLELEFADLLYPKPSAFQLTAHEGE